MKTIKLSNGMYATVDDADYAKMSQWSWKYLLAYECEGGYAVRSSRDKNGKDIAVLMHREINQTPAGMSTDHINGDKLDNRRCNLRTVTQSENMLNRGKQKNNKSGHKGVCWDSSRNKWKASKQINGVTVLQKRFTQLADAIAAHDDFESHPTKPNSHSERYIETFPHREARRPREGKHVGAGLNSPNQEHKHGA